MENITFNAEMGIWQLLESGESLQDGDTVRLDDVVGEIRRDFLGRFGQEFVIERQIQNESGDSVFLIVGYGIRYPLDDRMRITLIKS